MKTGLVMCMLASAFVLTGQFKHETTIKTKADFFTVDPLGNIFIAEAGAIIKIDGSTGKKYHFSNPMYGNFGFIDSSNPLNILAFSADLGIIAFLDKQLVEKDVIKTDDDFFYDKPILACNSRLEGFWIYQHEYRQISRLNRKSQVLASTIALNQLDHDFSQPCFMIEVDSRLYVSDNKKGIFVFDIFGGFLFKIPLKNVCKFQVIDNYIVYLTKKHLCLYNFFIHEEKVFMLPVDDAKTGVVRHPYIYIHTKKGVKKYYTNIEIF